MTGTYGIAEVAERSGFPATTIRYYEAVGLLPAPQRTPHGYRTYGEEVLDRLAFVARAKELGCTLPEITDLLAVREDGRCAPVQSRLRELVGARIADAQRRAEEVATFTAELRQAAAALAEHTPDGPCDDRCGCSSTPARAESAPIACTLDEEARPARIAGWHLLLAGVTGRDQVEGGLRLTFAPSPVTAAAIATLAAEEQDCCRFFRFAVTMDERGLALEVRAPDSGRHVVDALFG